LAPRNTWELEYLLLRIPVEIHNAPRGGKVFSMHREQVQEILGLSDGDISRLCDRGLILPRPEKPPRRPRIDYERLAHSYREIMEQGNFASQADLACHLGVSRVWVSRVLNGSKEREQKSRKQHQEPD
jgi:ParB-like chromosome segregation protein Spo0J